MSKLSYRCSQCGAGHDVESIRRSMYYGQRAIGDWQALGRGRLTRRLIRRRVTRTLMRELWK